jgi:hypothetical protein
MYGKLGFPALGRARRREAVGELVRRWEAAERRFLLFSISTRVEEPQTVRREPADSRALLRVRISWW